MAAVILLHLSSKVEKHWVIVAGSEIAQTPGLQSCLLRTPPKQTEPRKAPTSSLLATILDFCCLTIESQKE